jgi:RNA polymerase sigma-70 factor (ECF subfamily)
MYREHTNVVRLRPGGSSGTEMRIEPDRYISTRKAPNLETQTNSKKFEEIFVAHLDAAYDLAHWLTRDKRNAEDVVQEACLRAFKFINSFHGDNGRAWLLAIVRNTYYTWLDKNRTETLNVPFDEDGFRVNGSELAALESDSGNGVERLLQQKDARRLINEALGQLPPEFREVIVLREMEELSYKEIAAIANIPIGTVMSRLARARKLLLHSLRQHGGES